ncbi:MAG: hypothetical protein H5U40_08320, partial [Polyangiaceae bacterium]|nr:hypothetical protein [Polyangiaceae bacterium]
MRCKRLGAFLIDEGFISRAQLELVLREQSRRRRRRIGEVLVDLGYLSN